MKYLLLIIFALAWSNAFCQHFTQKDSLTLYSLEVEWDRYDLNDRKVSEDFQQILLLEKKRKSKKAGGFAFVATSAICFGLGALMQANSNRNSAENWMDGFAEELGNEMNRGLGIFFTSVGVANAGLAIPFFISSGKKKRERDKLLKLYRN